MDSEDNIKTQDSSQSPVPKRLLLIDDEPGVVLALKLLIQTMGFVVEAFTEPEKALEFIRANSGEASLGQSAEASKPLVVIDYILCDLRMPRKTGMDVLKETKKMAAQIPFYLMSGHAEDEEQKLAIESGAAGFLAKPFSPGDLLKLLK